MLVFSSPVQPPVVAIVGRPNVGKSSLFNRIVGHRVALVEDEPGTTRDRITADLDWYGRTLRVVDTGGLETAPKGLYSALIRSQIEAAMEEADALVFVVDGRDGLTAEDYEVAEILRRASQPVVLVANKVDNERRELDLVDCFRLGLGQPVAVSAYHGYGVADMLDRVVDQLPQPPQAEDVERGTAIAIIGRPNAGKSMLLNALLGEERVIVSEIPGTTRDAIDTTLEFEGQRLTLIDTAGIRRRGHIVPGVEGHSVLRARDAVARSDVAVIVIDSTDAATAQDAHVVQIADEAAKGIVLAINKADLLDGPGSQQELARFVRQRLRFVPWAPIVLISAKERTGLDKLMRESLQAAEQRKRRVATGPLNALLHKVMATHPPRSVQGRRLKLLYATQSAISPPEFVLFVNDSSLLHFSYQRYLENQLRAVYGFGGTTVRFVFKSRGEQPDAERGLGSREALPPMGNRQGAKAMSARSASRREARKDDR